MARNHSAIPKPVEGLPISANPFRSIAKTLHLTMVRAAGAAAIVTTAVLGWMIGNGGTAQPAKADTPPVTASAAFAKAAKTAPEISRTEIVIKAEPRPAATTQVDYLAMIDHDVSEYEASAKANVQKVRVAKAAQKDVPKAESADMKSGFNKGAEADTPWSDRPGVKEALAAIDDYNAAASDDETRVLDMLAEEEAMLEKMHTSGKAGAVAESATPRLP